MPRAPPAGFFVLASIVFFLWYVVWTQRHVRPTGALSHAGEFSYRKDAPSLTTGLDDGATTLKDDDTIMAKLENETLKAELGRAAWKLFHTTMARFPDQPTEDESSALDQYIHLFARLYPCGECATHFQKILKKYPPQTSSRSTAAVWACFVHNEVNKSKGKPEFNCANIGDFYDCGCADEEKEKVAIAGGKSEAVAKGDIVEIQREGPTRGG